MRDRSSLVDQRLPLSAGPASMPTAKPYDLPLTHRAFERSASSGAFARSSLRVLSAMEGADSRLTFKTDNEDLVIDSLFLFSPELYQYRLYS